MDREGISGERALFGGSGYVRRLVDDELDALVPSLAAILLDGPKGVGKTCTALQRAKTVRRLDVPQQRAVAESDPDIVLEGEPPVLLDEWQQVPSTWDAVKRAVDANPTAGRFLLTGSEPVAGTPTHSGAGRIAPIRMRPLTLPERGVCTPSVSLGALLSGERGSVSGECPLGLGDYTDQILASGLPGMQGLSPQALRTQLDGYLDRIVRRDMPEAGLSVRRPATLRAWLAAYAAATSTDASWETIRDAASSGQQTKPARQTGYSYADALSGLRILDELAAWTPSLNHLGRLNQAAKHHLADPALAARLVGVTREDLIAGRPGALEIPRDGTFLGALFESLATMSVRVFAQAVEARVSHLRLQSGRREVDLIVETGAGIVALEVKLASAVDSGDMKHLLWLREQIGDRLLDAAVLTTGSKAYRRKDGIAVIPLGLLGP